jgi:hypothetical protein
MGQVYNLQNNREIDQTRWQTLAKASLGFWISNSLLLDFAILPTLWATGMMDTNSFASVGYSIFWVFNRIELLCAATILTSMWAMKNLDRSSVDDRGEMLAGAAMLFAIALIYTFILTPYMGGLGINLDLFAFTRSIPSDMNQMHSIYWVLEASKLGIATMLLTAKN